MAQEYAAEHRPDGAARETAREKVRVVVRPRKGRRAGEAPVPGRIYPVIDTDLGRDNVEKDLPAADREDLQ